MKLAVSMSCWMRSELLRYTQHDIKTWDMIWSERQQTLMLKSACWSTTYMHFVYCCCIATTTTNKTLFIVLDVTQQPFWQSGRAKEAGEAPQYLSIVSNHRMYFHFPTVLWQSTLTKHNYCHIQQRVDTVGTLMGIQMKWELGLVMWIKAVGGQLTNGVN